MIRQADLHTKQTEGAVIDSPVFIVYVISIHDVKKDILLLFCPSKNMVNII